MPIQVAITDDHPLVVDGLLNALQTSAGIVVINTYNSGAELLEGMQHTRPDVLLLDMQLPDTTGAALVPVLMDLYPEVRILILSGIDSVQQVQSMIDMGCMGYLLKTTTNQQLLLQAVTEVYHNKVFLDPQLKEELLAHMLNTRKKDKDKPPDLTRREKEILQLIVAEYNNQEIAEKLFLSLRTVENHRYNLLQKLNAKNTVSLVRIAMSMNLLNNKD